ncbi:hypothetical protein QJQ45_007249 [Haematococcus lacustris]|nr:hypothetical protein QJQ45_007249 [Haematococcus lacustris]
MEDELARLALAPREAVVLMRCCVPAERCSPRQAPQAPRSSQPATQPAASEPGPSAPPPAQRSKRTKAELAAEPTQPTKSKGEAQGKAAKAKPAPQPGKWLDRDCNAMLNKQRIGESKWRPLELCYWPEQGKLPAKGKEYPDWGTSECQTNHPRPSSSSSSSSLLCHSSVFSPFVELLSACK